MHLRTEFFAPDTATSPGQRRAGANDDATRHLFSMVPPRCGCENGRPRSRRPSSTPSASRAAVTVTEAADGRRACSSRPTAGVARTGARCASSPPTTDVTGCASASRSTARPISVCGTPLRPAARWHLGRIGPNDKPPFWFPPDNVDDRAHRDAGASLARSPSSSATAPRCSRRRSPTRPKSSAPTRRAQGIALASVRVDVLLALPLALLADRRGRRWLARQRHGRRVRAHGARRAGAQPVRAHRGAGARARGHQRGVVDLGVMVAEEMPAGARAWATSLTTMAGFVGGGTVRVRAAARRRVTSGAWRVLYLVPLLFIPLARRIGSRIAGNARFERARREPCDRTPRRVARHARPPRPLSFSSAVRPLLLSLFATPASQFQNEFLRNERGFSGAQITLFIMLTSIPGGSASSSADGWPNAAAASSARSRCSAASGAPCCSTGPFGASDCTCGRRSARSSAPRRSPHSASTAPSCSRPRRAARPTAASACCRGIGSVIGLSSPATSPTASACPGAHLSGDRPVHPQVLILVAYPETAHRELEDLNPEDAPALNRDFPQRVSHRRG